MNIFYIQSSLSLLIAGFRSQMHEPIDRERDRNGTRHHEGRLRGNCPRTCLRNGVYEPRWFMETQHMNLDDAVRARVAPGRANSGARNRPSRDAGEASELPHGASGPTLLC